MPKPRKRKRIQDLQYDATDVVIAEHEDEATQIKIEPVDTGEYEPMDILTTKTVVYTANDDNVADVEAEMGLESQIEFMKTEVDVDEGTLRDFRDEMMQMSREITTKPPNRKRKNRNRKRKLETVHEEANEQTGCSETEPKEGELQPLDIVLNGIKMCKCHFCDFQSTSRNRSIVKEHMRIHTGVTPYACRHCPQKFTTRNNLWKHVRRDHPTKKRYKCPLCGVWFFTKNDFDSHDLKCVRRRTFECHLCKFKMNHLYMYKVTEHMKKEHTGEKIFQCEHCEETFVTKKSLDFHKKHHPEAKPFKCHNCKNRYATQETLKTHESHCQHRTKFECHLCKYSYVKLNFKGLKLHMRKHTGEKPHQCQYCHKFYPRIQRLKYHLQTHRDLFKLKCAQCHQRFMDATELEKHESNCRRIRYECYLCGHSNFGVSFSSFRKHMRSHTSPKLGWKIFKCHLCPRKFQMKHNLRAHIKSHTKIGLLKCDYCDKQFLNLAHKKKHEYSCKRVYECYMCKKTLPSFAVLKGTHMKTHLGERPYSCTHCTKIFSSIRTYSLHVLNVHVQQYKFECNTCNGIIEQRQDIAKHQRSCMKGIRKSVGIVYFKCSLCGIGLPRPPDVRKHILNAECTNHPKKNEEPPTKKRKIDLIELEKEEEAMEEDTGIDETEPKQVELQPLDIVLNGVKMCKCHFCDFQSTSRNRSVVKEHMRIHTGVTPYACRHCPQKFTTRINLWKHVRRDHPTKKRYKCPLCGVWFFTKSDFDSHDLKCVKRRTFECHLCKFKLNRLYMHRVTDHMRKEHTGEKTFQCEHCEETFITKTSLDFHKKHHPEAKPFKCSNCKNRYTTEETLKTHERHCFTRQRFECYLCAYSHPKLNHDGLIMHMRKHTGEKPFQCQYCQKFYPRVEALKYHLQRHRDLFNFKCAQCHRRFSNANELQQHEKTCVRRRYECYMCGHSHFGVSFSSFRQHMVKHTGEGLFKCIGCTQAFSSRTTLAGHIAEKHAHLLGLTCPNCYRIFDSKNMRNLHQAQCTKQRIECYICKATSKDITKLRNHIMKKHTGCAQYKCHLCPRKYMFEFNLKIHIRWHTKVGFVKCDYCKKKFSDIRYKKMHEFNCKKVYECYMCRKKFPSFAVLQGTHMRTHLGERPYSCTHCTKTFVSIRTYGLHVLPAHLHQYKFKCNTCNGILEKRQDLRKHERSCMKPIRKSAGVIYFKCSLCDLGLPRVTDVRKHVLNAECAKHPKKLR